jgi:hypothetical protein
MNSFVKKIKKVLGISSVPYIYAYLYAISYKNYLISLFKPDVITTYKEHLPNQSILLIALFEKTYLRKDIIRLLEASKRAGLYVVAVNTRKLSKAFLEEHQHIFDVYISQYNYGRDFASYQKGFKYIFENKLQQHAERIVMLNDSLYYDADRTPQFLDDMINAPVEVLGATENHEINYHLGSFAISFAKTITNNAKFIKYWKNYKRSDIRPLVIKRGEMGLSKMLAKITSNEFEMKALYDASSVRGFLKQSNENLTRFSDVYRHSDLVDWPRLSHVGLLEDFLTYTKLISGKEKKDKLANLDDERKISTVRLERTGFNPNDMYVTSIENIDIYLNRIPNKANDIYEQFSKFVISKSVSNSRHGSQIHQNNASFVLMGLPIIKLDGMYRGMFSELDITNFQKLLRSEYFNELIEILYKKPYGGDVLVGWKQVAFFRGLI